MNIERDKLILQKALEGASNSTIAQQFSLTKERVRQIIEPHKEELCNIKIRKEKQIIQSTDSSNVRLNYLRKKHNLVSLSKQQKQKQLEVTRTLYLQGTKCSDIAKILNVNRRTIYIHLQDLFISKQQKQTRNELIKKNYQQGKTYKQIAEQYNLTIIQIYNIIKERIAPTYSRNTYLKYKQKSKLKNNSKK